MFYQKSFLSFFFSLIILVMFLTVSSPAQEIVDCLVASVGEEAITLTDLRIFREFILLPFSRSELTPEQLLAKVMDIKVVVKLARMEAEVSQEEVRQAIEFLGQTVGWEHLRQRLEFYGLSMSQLEDYWREKLLYEKIISLRSSLRVSVTLREIETYYAEKYVAEKKAKKEEVKPLVEIVSEIEAQLRQEKTRQQVENWVESLKGQTTIRIRPDCLKFL